MMKPLKIVIAPSLFFLLAGSFAACKKNNDKKSVCKMISANITGVPEPERFIYNSAGKLSRSSTGLALAVYDYAGDSIVITRLDTGRFTSRTVATLNASGLATNVKAITGSFQTDWTNTAYEYNGQELIRATSTSSSDNTPHVTRYGWANQNLVMQISGTDTARYDYYTDKPLQPGDYFDLTQFIQGFQIIRNKNLLKSTYSELFTYDFGANGNITTLSATSGLSRAFIDYEYQCD